MIAYNMDKEIHGQIEKYCTKCHQLLPLSLFYNDKKSKLGVTSQCRKCTDERHRIYNLTDSAKESVKRYYRKRGKDVIKEYQKSDKYKECRKRYEASERCKIKQRKFEESDKRKQYLISYRKTDSYHEVIRRYQQSDKCKETTKRRGARRRSGVGGRISDIMRYGMYMGLKHRKGRRHWESFVDYDLKDLMKHLEKQFVDGMNWDNYGRGIGKWHIDHILPLTAFCYENEMDIDFKRCWSLSNLRPLWGADNISKSDKIIKPFQPSLDVLLYKGEIKNKVDTTIKELHSVYKCVIVS
jgi:hypothetical protein